MPGIEPTNHIFVRIHGDNHNNHDYIVDNNHCMNSGYCPSLTRTAGKLAKRFTEAQSSLASETEPTLAQIGY